MMDNHVNIIGEGLVGRVAFTGNHQWILSENYFREAHPPEVLKEVCQQFSGGMQTVAVVPLPVLPHGIVQFGSFLTMMENMGFVNDVTSLLLQRGYVSGLLSKNYAANEHGLRIGVPACLGNSTPAGYSLEFESFNYVGNSNSTSVVDTHTSFSLAGEIQNELQSNGAAFQASNSNPSNSVTTVNEAKIAPGVKFDFSSSN